MENINSMKIRMMLFAVVLISLFCFTSVSASTAVKVRVLDQNNKPVPNAVVSIAADKEITPSDSLAVMDQIDRQFAPHILTIEKGRKVTFPNSDNVRHNVYSFSSPKPFEIRMFNGSDSSPVEFDKAGIVVLGCNIHDSMVGFIFVGDDELSAITDDDGIASLASFAPEVTVWHPRLSRTQNTRKTVNIAAEKGHGLIDIMLPLIPLKENQTSNKFKRKFSRGST